MTDLENNFLNKIQVMESKIFESSISQNEKIETNKETNLANNYPSKNNLPDSMISDPSNQDQSIFKKNDITPDPTINENQRKANIQEESIKEKQREIKKVVFQKEERFEGTKTPSILNQEMPTKKQQEIPKEMKQNIKNIFDIFDSSREGAINITDVKAILRSLNYDPTAKDIEDITKEYDQKNIGKLRLIDLYKVIEKIINKPSNFDELLKSLKIFDEDNDGKLKIQEFKEALNLGGERINTDLV